MNIPLLPRRRWRRAAVSTAVTAALAATAFVGVPANAAHAQANCLVVNQQTQTWASGPTTGGVYSNLTLTNVCDTPVNGWVLALTLAPGHGLDHGWNADWSATGTQVTAGSLPWNTVIQPGASTTIGYIGSWSGSPQGPVSCTINGTPCDGSPEPGDGPVVTLTSPTDGSGVPGPCPVVFSADASAPDGEVDRVEFYLNDVLVGTDHDAPYRVEIPPGHPAYQSFGDNVVFARAFDDGDPARSADSEPASFTQAPIPPALMILSCTPRLELEEGTAATVTLVAICSGTPELEFTITGDADISVTATSSPPSDPRPNRHDVIVSAAADGAGTATIQVTPTDPNCLRGTIQVTVAPATT